SRLVHSQSAEAPQGQSLRTDAAGVQRQSQAAVRQGRSSARTSYNSLSYNTNASPSVTASLDSGSPVTPIAIAGLSLFPGAVAAGAPAGRSPIVAGTPRLTSAQNNAAGILRPPSA